MLQSRLRYLVGVGTLLSATFVNVAPSFIRRTNPTLLVSPLQIAQAMHCCNRGIHQ